LMFGGVATMVYSRGELRVDDLLEMKVSTHSHRDA